MLPIDESIGYLEKGTDMQSSERGTRRENRRQGEGKRQTKSNEGQHGSRLPAVEVRKSGGKVA